MQTYKAYFHTDAGYAARELEADTPEQALALARRFYDNDPSDLMFESYGGGLPVLEIAIHDADSNRLAVWYDDDMRLRLAAHDLLAALEFIAADIDEGIRGKAAWLKIARAAIAKAKGGAA
jgi:hypothetical protein